LIGSLDVPDSLRILALPIFDEGVRICAFAVGRDSRREEIRGFDSIAAVA
jgi:hypothetical protein